MNNEYQAPLPDSAQAIADVIGREATLHLARNLPYNHIITNGGTCRLLYIPKKKTLTNDYWLVKVIGLEKAKLLQEQFGGCLITLAKCADTLRGERNAKIVNAYKAGKSVGEIAALFGLAQRTIADIVYNSRNNQ